MTPTETQSPPADSEQRDDEHVRGGEAIKRSPEEQAAIAATKSGTKLTEKQVEQATAWFLSEEEEQPTVLAFDVNVAAAGLPPRWIRWQVRSLGRQEIKRIRKEATDRETGETDDMEMNMRVIIASSVEPNLLEVAQQRGIADPADLVNKRFGHKPGIIEAIARKANEMSGYGANADIIRPVDAAGN